MMKTILAAASIAALFAVPTFAQDASPEGTWKDRWGTTFTFSLCGDGNTNLCGTLNDIQGDSRTEENLAFVNQQVVQGVPTGPNKWEGNISLNGGNAKAIVELVDANTLKITGCQGILCNSIDYART
ncbi:DUF2147 domain-containing protein [Devosia aurantiaca]|jgi:uncharacterized protein (DUF2147 family)|uniref:DUF2147 domain-containing protein n=1 Tax=Devosia aurantiaca TaxID=2714858 RepID=A0A6M1SHZ7_9HYPH|nr:hypothetical protein [Devosia aurantiaca]NGP16780.1 hypothetical protein [Devosia aurantiaca]